jgi:GTP cyclohydrolase IB
MNIHMPMTEREPNRAEAEAALSILRAWTGRATDSEVAALEPALMRLIPGQSDPEYPVFRRE